MAEVLLYKEEANASRFVMLLHHTFAAFALLVVAEAASDPFEDNLVYRSLVRGLPQVINFKYISYFSESYSTPSFSSR